MTTATASSASATSIDAPMTHRAVLTALSGLIVGMFVAVLSSTVVSTSLPRIISDLGGDQAAYTWVITATLLATAVSTPIWGKLADLTNRKVLLQVALAIFVIGTVIAGFSQSTEMLISMRVVQGLGAGGLMALVQIVVADIVSPRERGKYMGIVGGIMALATIGGPLLGGFITDTFGWRGNFFIGVPFAIAALFIIQRTLHLPGRAKRKVRIDYFGAVLLSAGISLLLIWVTMGGHQFEWNSMESWLIVGGAALALIAFVITELVVKEPIVPLTMFKSRTFTLAVIASLSVGVAMFGTSVFLAQYMQLARGANPTESGLLTLPMVIGQMAASIGIGALISRFGRWKAALVTGSALVLVGATMMSTLRYDTPYALVSVYMFLLGAGLGIVMQNLVLVVQNSAKASELGAASAGVTFFRSISGTIGVSIMGSILATQVASHIASGLKSLKPADLVGAQALQGGTIPQVSKLPLAIRTVVESAYGQGVADVFLIVIPLAIIAIIAIAFLPNKPLSNKTASQRAASEAAEESVIELAEAETGAPVIALTPEFAETDEELEAELAAVRDEDDSVTSGSVRS